MSKSVAEEIVDEKLRDAMEPGFQADFTPEEAEIAGAFREDALTVGDALESVHDSEV